MGIFVNSYTARVLSLPAGTEHVVGDAGGRVVPVGALALGVVPDLQRQLLQHRRLRALLLRGKEEENSGLGGKLTYMH